MYSIKELFDLDHTLAKSYLEQFEKPWDALNGIKDMIIELGNTLPADEYDEVKENVWIHKTAKVFPTAWIDGPCIIGANTQVRHCAFVRGSALVGENCVIGNSVELKNVIIFDNVEVPHYNYAGDSILGYHSHLGAGSITSNLKSARNLIEIKDGDERVVTGRKKIGAFLGDWTEVGCNSVLNPGTVIGQHCIVYPTSCVRGVIPHNSIHKNNGTVIKKR